MIRILITGCNSYIGTSFEQWIKSKPNQYHVDTLDMTSSSWKEADFSTYDVVFHVAGIAHVSSDPRLRELYYKVNKDLTIETAVKAKLEGVTQFIFMSSIIVYGDSSEHKRIINVHTTPNPSNFYGDSKLQAELGIRELESSNFRVVILRPPMIYGKGSKGNYPQLSKLAKKTPFFPDYNNERSMLHIDNLCELIKVLIDYKETGLFYPQNEEYVKTSEMVRIIGELHGHRVLMTRIFNPFIRLMLGKVQIINKVFGNLVYDHELSEYDKANYRVRTFKESIELTEL